VVLDDERAAKAIPDGWCLVPAKATDAMVNAVRAGKLEPASPFHVQRAIETIKSNYLKMLAAVPAEPAEWPDAKACAVSPQATADTPAKLARDAVRMLEGYAESYESMAKMDSKSGDGTVQCRSVARDIRANMAGWFGPHLTEQATATQPAQTERALTDEQVAAIMTQAQVFASAYSLVGSRFDNGDGFEHSEAMKEELRTLLTAAQSASGAGHE
jgi:hypothetical protein